MREQFAWNFAAQAVGLVLPPLLIVILARILEPSDFGVFALLMVVISVIQSMSLSPLGEVIIKSDREDIGDFIFSLQLVIGIAFSVVLFLGADLVAGLFNKPELASPLRVSCLLLLISPLVDTAIRMSMRKIAFKAVFVRRVVSPIANAFVSIPLAIYGVGYWALVWGQISGIVVAAFVIVAMGGWQPHFNLKFKFFQKELLFSWQMLLQSASRWARAHSDKAILGFHISLDTLGQYDMARLLAVLPFTSIINSVSQVIYAVMADRIRRGEDISELFLLAQRRVLMVTLPLCVIMMFNAEGLIAVILGEKWLGISDVFVVMVLVGAIYSSIGFNVEVFKAMGKPDIMTNLMLVNAIFALVTFIWLAPKGVYAISIGILGLSVVFSPLNGYLTLRLLGVRFLDYFAYVTLRPALIAITVTIANYSLDYLALGHLQATVMKVAIGGIIVFAASFYWERGMFTRAQEK